MSKRLIATSLGFFVGWVGGAFFAFVSGMPAILAPVVGTMAAALVYRDPRGWIWTR